MTTDLAIRFDGVGKRFKLNSDQSESVLDTIISSFSRSRTSKGKGQFLWAVKDVSFDILPGESIGFVGRNGSGKSTILKLASGIIRPTTGSVEIRGRLSALLELGAGFHPDLTGRENISLNASILGLSNAEIDKVYDDIVDFSELGEFINMPVKHYSSGMYMRLGFSVAVHVEPDILLIDEILAVGDQAFQEKCVERLHKMKDMGTTVVFVSHNMEMVRSLCSRILWIENGQAIADGSADELLQQYLESYESPDFERDNLKVLPRQRGSGDIELSKLRLLSSVGEELDQFTMGESITIEMHYVANQPVERPEFVLALHREDADIADEPDSQLTRLHPGTLAGSGIIRCHIDHLPLAPAVYYLSAGVYDAQTGRTFDHHERVSELRVLADPTRRGKGIIDIPATWESEEKESISTIEPSVNDRKTEDVKKRRS